MNIWNINLKNCTTAFEPHHIRQLSDDGPDTPAWVAAICPTYHREIHHGENGAKKNHMLQERISEIEKNFT